jgi:hypothetical protein
VQKVTQMLKIQLIMMIFRKAIRAIIYMNGNKHGIMNMGRIDEYLLIILRPTVSLFGFNVVGRLSLLLNSPYICYMYIQLVAVIFFKLHP